MIPTLTLDLLPIGNTEETDALTIITHQRRIQMAFNLCDRARNRCAWLLADKAAKAWELGGCAALGVPAPEERE